MYMWFSNREEDTLSRLLNTSWYSGFASLMYIYQRKHLSFAKVALVGGDGEEMRQLIRAFCLVIDRYSRGGYFKKALALFFITKVSLWVTYLKKHIPPALLTVEDHYFEIFLFASKLSLLQTFKGKAYAFSVSLSFTREIQKSLLEIERICGEEAFFSSENYQKENYANRYGRDSLYARYKELLMGCCNGQYRILAEALLYNLFLKGLYGIASPCTARERIWAYAMVHGFSKDVAMMKTVHTLFRVIDYHEDAAKIKKQILFSQAVAI